LTIKEDAICAVNGHSIALPDLSIPDHDEKISGNKRFLIHETYFKCLPAIQDSGLSKMGRNNIHLGFVTGKAGLQKKQKTNIGIYVEVTKAKRFGLRLLHCANDVVMCPGNQTSFISPHFFHEIWNTSTRDLIEFSKPVAPDMEQDI